MGSLLRRALGVLLILTALLMALTREPDRPPESLVARWALPPSSFVVVQGQVVHLRDEGPRDDPLPLVLLHGTSASLHTWDGWAKALAPRRRVVRLDLPGFGLTGPWDVDAGPYLGAGYDAATDARFVLDVLTQLGIGRAVLAGNSLGGEVAWRVAAAAPARVAGLVLVDAAGPAFVPQAVPLGWRIARAPVLHHLARWSLPRAIVAQGLHVAYGDPARIDEALVDRYHALTLRAGNRQALVQRLQAFRPGADDAGIDAVTAPTLILWGGRDRLIPPAVGEEFERRIRGSTRIVFDALGHVPHEEDPAATVAPVQAFLDRVAPGRPAAGS